MSLKSAASRLSGADAGANQVDRTGGSEWTFAAQATMESTQRCQ